MFLSQEKKSHTMNLLDVKRKLSTRSDSVLIAICSLVLSYRGVFSTP